MSEGKVGCSEKVHDAFGVGFHPCSRVGRVERDGKWYCSQHDPCYVKKRREQRQVENQQQLKHQRIYSQVDMDAALRRAKGEGALKWTEDLPEKPGKYWWKLHPDSEPEIMSVLAYADGSAMPHCDYGQWAGPITPPLDARAAQIEEGGGDGRSTNKRGS